MVAPIIDVLIMGIPFIGVSIVGTPIKGIPMQGTPNLDMEIITRSFGQIRANE
jgi:hypothetical protein